MIVYNVTSKVDHSIANAWIQWLKDEHIPELLNTGCFIRANIYHLIELDDQEGITYTVQYHAQNKEQYDTYINEHAPLMRNKSTDKWNNKVISFRTVMKSVN